jgi:hypothetical protein
MVLPAVWCGVVLVATASPKVALLRLEPAEPVEREALEALRTEGGVGADFVDVRAARDAVVEDEARALLATARVVVWFEAAPGALVVHVMGSDGKTRVRSLPWTEAEGTAAVSENAASVGRSMVVSMLQRPVAEPQPRPVVEVTPPPVAAPPPPAPATALLMEPRVALGAGYVGSTVGDGLAWQHGVRVTGEVRPWRRLLAALEASYLFDVTGRWATGRFRVTRQTASLSSGWSWALGRLEVAALVGAGVEHVWRVVEAVEGAVATAPRSLWWPTVVTAAQARVRFGAFAVQGGLGVRSPLRALEFRAAPDDALVGTVAPVRLEVTVAGAWCF